MGAGRQARRHAESSGRIREGGGGRGGKGKGGGGEKRQKGRGQRGNERPMQGGQKSVTRVMGLMGTIPQDSGALRPQDLGKVKILKN